MKIELVQPLHAHYGTFGKRESLIFKPAQLTMPYLAALVPSDIDVSIIDEITAPAIPENSDADLVGITFVTPFAHRAYELAERYRKQGRTVVFGGPHVSLVPDEAQRFADAVVVGEAEDTWPLVISDFQKKRLRSRYRSSTPSLSSLPFARRNLLRKNSYIVHDVIQASRGCPFRCDFCALGAVYGHGHRTRPIHEVLREIETFDGDTFIFWDDNIVGSPNYSKELFRRLIPYKKKWLGQGSITVTRDPALLRLAAESGCIGLFIGIESVSQGSLESVNKGFNRVGSLQTDIQKLHDAGIAVLAGIIFGFDTDDETVFDRTLDIAVRSAIDGISFSILTPYPGTKLFHKLTAEGRILHYDWPRYNSEYAVFVPRLMSPEQLEEGHNRANREFYSASSIMKRLLKSRTQLGLTVKLNLADRKYSYGRFKPAS